MKFDRNIVALAVCWLLIMGAGVYVTYFQQPEELERVEKAEKVARMKYAELAELRNEEAMMSLMTKEAARKWQTRYKIIPDTLSSPEVVGFMNDLTRSGFENFDVTYGGAHRTSGYSYYAYRVTGRGYYTSLYRVIWEVENNRRFYNIKDLQLRHIDLVKPDRSTGNPRLQVMVSFDFTIHAYYRGIDGVSAPDQLPPGILGDETPTVQSGDLPPVPVEVLPDRRPQINPFFPVVMSQLPPNTHGYVDIDEAKLVSIVGNSAVFQEKDGYRTVNAGDPVYLGQLLVADPVRGRIVARLNRGGIIDEVELFLQTGERFRQALGPAVLEPLAQ